MEYPTTTLGDIVRLEDRAAWAARRSSRHRAAEARRAARRRKQRMAFLPLALAGWVLGALPQVLSDHPFWPVAIAGALCAVPWLATFDVLGLEQEARNHPRGDA